MAVGESKLKIFEICFEKYNGRQDIFPLPKKRKESPENNTTDAQKRQRQNN